MAEVRADEADEAALQRYAAELAEAATAALPGWVERSVRSRCAAVGRHLDAAEEDRLADAAQRCAHELGPQLRALLDADLDAQVSTPLALLRTAVRHPTEQLDALGVPVPQRDEFAVRALPEDRYDLAPASFADVDESLAEPGLRWGAAKAHVHLARRRAEGRR